MGFRDIGKALALVRQQRGLTQARLAARCGMSRPQVSRYESGKELMKLETLEKILRTLTVEPDEFFHFLRSLDDSNSPQQSRAPDRIDDRMLADAFRNLHRAIDGLHQVVERAVARSGGLRAVGQGWETREAERRSPLPGRLEVVVVPTRTRARRE
ncbi:MAG TPA: helix-turn-helix transcriptional regulator [Thermoanaerobaculia bacterium]